MRNRPFHEMTRPQSRDRPLIDHSPQLRLWVLFVLFLAPAAVIIVRLYHVQTALTPVFVADWERTTETLEPIPARDGRILTADGLVLAFDEPKFDIALHYRWLEDPPQPEWLDSQARLLLKPAERRDKVKLARAREIILGRRAAAFAELSEVTGQTPAELAESCRRVQTRIERMYALVEERQARRAENSDAAPPADPAANWTEQAWSNLKSALTTPPERPQHDPLVIREQLMAHVVVESVPLTVVTAIESAPSRFPGVEVQRATRRVYPAGKLAAHIVGARTPVDDEELEQAKKLHSPEDPPASESGGRIGRSGIERAYDAQLRGQIGVRRIVRDRRGQIVRTDDVRPASDGRDVVLSFDSRLQARAEALLDAVLDPPSSAANTAGEPDEPLDAPPPPAPPLGGCIVALDVRNGRVLAAAAAPRFDANLIVHHEPAAWDAAVADPRQPFFPRVTQMTIPPGSVFKTLTAIALLESGQFDPDEQFYCQGYLDEPNRHRCLIYRHYGAGHGLVTLDDALCRSCNVYFFDAARRIGPQPIHDWAARFGFGRLTGADLPGERSGNLPTPGESGQKWFPGTTLQFAIGQASLAVTPLQVAQMMAAVANDGFLVTPTFVRPTTVPSPSDDRKLQLASFEATAARPTRQQILGLTPGTLARVRVGLRMVVEDSHGTGKRVRLDEVAVAGKTGTAEVGGGKPDHAWFAGYVPADNPRVAFVVVLEHGGSGGHVAGPVAHDFVQALLQAGVIPPDRQAAD